ncbi:TonB-dependent receptor domain-containing protein [Sphingomonas profundi]|uniref:TonB-dependent receptor domain-containing protein n=1 Tax=Alterirhizorhabdus profundi TaxID=2681549 RepID=UPI0012E6F9F0|nr:TonB-dependent receptor [Sphingomonas profundi]
MKVSIRSILLVGCAAAAVSPATAFAQEALPATPQERLADRPAAADDQPGSNQPGSDQAAAEQSPGDLVVTGTRIVRNGFEAPTPVSVVTAAEIDQSAPVTIADYVNQLPALAGSETPRTPRGSLASGSAGANYLNLRNLGAPRTLVLLNGRRVTPSNLTGAVDLNTLPSALVKRVDVVTGGASATWGSDAVAGVVNFVLDTDFTGLKGQLQGGTSTHGDAESFGGDLSFGRSFADDRGHITLSGNYSKSYRAKYSDRDWFKAYKIINNPAFAAGNGQPARLILPNTSLNVNDEGFVASGPLRGYFFDANGGLAGTNFQFAPVISGIYASGSEADYSRLDDLSKYGESNVPVEQGSIYGRLSYELTDGLKAFAEGSFSKAKAKAVIAPFFRTGNTSIGIDNFYLPAQVRAAMVAAGVTSIPLSTTNSKLGALRTSTDREAIRALGGFEGKISDSWSYSLSYQYGRSDITILAPNNPRPARYALAVDAVANPASPGTAICRSTLTAPGNGCVPLNPFGSAGISSAQADYLIGVGRQDLVYRQDVASASANGDLFALPAGPVSLAFGVDYRREKASATSDAVSQVNGFYAGNYKPFRGRFSVKELFGELAIPVLKDSPLGTSLDLSLAGRVTDYSTSGTVETWKAGFTYKPIPDIDIRFTRSRDIRAPNLNELFLGGTVTTQNVADPFNNRANAQFLQTLRGNLDLQPEKANALTLGVIYRPSWLRGFAASVDYYDIKIGGAIATNSSQQIVDQCFAGNTALCGRITRNAANVITGILLQPFNARSERARGIDFELSYRTDVGAGTLDLRTLLNYTDKLDILSAGATVNRAGEVGNNAGAAEGVPSWRAFATATYSQGPATAQLKGRFIGASQIEQNWGPLDINRNHVPAIFYMDAYIGYKLKIAGGDSELFVAMDNVLDKDPPVVASQDNANVLTSGTNVLLYDIIGRSVRAGVRFSF